MSGQNQDGYGTLEWIIGQSEYGLFLAIADETIQQEIVDFYHNQAIAVYDYKQYHKERPYKDYSFQTLKDWVDSAKNINTFFIMNFQLAIQSEQDLKRLNFSRDMLARLEKNLIFFTTAYGDDRMAASAYDFYSFIKIRIIFHNHTLEKQTHYSSLNMETEAMPEDETWNPSEVKQKINEASSLIRQAKENNNQDKHEENLKSLLKAKGIYEKILGPEHLDIAVVYNELANAYIIELQYTKAEEFCKRALATYAHILGENHPATASCYNLLAHIYQKQGQYKKAEEQLLKAIAICENIGGKEHPDAVKYRNNLDELYRI